jgi:hypothetical protein
MSIRQTIRCGILVAIAAFIGITCGSGPSTSASTSSSTATSGSTPAASSSTRPASGSSRSAVTYTFGDTGPGGGKVFYYNAKGFTVQMANPKQNYTAHYLEAAPDDMRITLAWSSAALNQNGVYIHQFINTETAIGTGRKNTALILATDANAPAAKACRDYNAGGQTDWFFPSKEELNQLFVNKTFVGNMGEWNYWSSSQFNNASAWNQRYNNGGFTNHYKDAVFYVRAIRAF